MDLRDLKLFLHLAESCHFGRTARAMHVSPSTLSRQIQRLEEDVGHALFLRDNRTVTLTEAGERLRQFAQQTLLQYQQLRHVMDLNGPSLSGELRLRTQATQALPEWSQIPFILPEQGPARRRIDLWFRRHRIANPLIYATVSGHEAIVSMVALGCGIALLPDVVLENSPEPVRNRVMMLENVESVAPFELGVCGQKKRLGEPLISAFWSQL